MLMVLRTLLLHTVLVFPISLGLATPLFSADINAPAEFVIKPKIVASADRMLPVGFMNFCEPMGAFKMHQNTVFDFPGNEPDMDHAFGLAAEVRDKGKFVQLDGLLMNRSDGFYNGCSLRIYRIVDKEGKPLPISTTKTYAGYYLDLTNADHVAFVGRRQVSPKDGYVIDSPKQPFKAHFNLEDGIEILQWDAIFVEKETVPDENGVPFEREARWTPDPKNDTEPVKIRCAAHPKPLPAGVDFGKACLRLDLASGEHGVRQVCLGGSNVAWYGQLIPGQKYRLEVWMRQNGLANGGKVRFGMFDNAYPTIKCEFTVTNQWKQYTYDFVGPDFPPANQRPDGPGFWATGPGTLWIDNSRIFAYYDPADLEKPFVPVRQLVDEMTASQPASGQKGYLRSWAGMPSRTMESILGYYTSPSGGFRKEETIPMVLAYCEATGDSPGTRMKPWITINTFYTEDEWLMLFEYLAAPYDPGKDTPQSKPWAYRRTLQRGNSTPWTDTFDAILIELGNENWHNRANLEWIGFGRAGMIHGDGLQYGLWGKYLFSHVMEKSPYWKSAGLDRKIIFNLAAGYYAQLDKEGKPSGYGPDSIRGGWPTSRMSSMALYVGPRWELNEKSESTLTDEVFQRSLLAYQMGVKDKVLNTFAARAKMKEMGFDYDLVSYEGGPGGYGRQANEPSLQLGKSMALGVAALDAWLDSYQYGWVGHCLYASNQGDAWSNHTVLANGFRGTPAWQALTLRNRELRGDMMEVVAESVPLLATHVLDNKGNRIRDKVMNKDLIKEFPLTRCYAFQQGNRWSVCLLSLKMAGKHNDQDFGDGSAMCSVALPFQTAKKITLVALEGSPRDTNEQELKISPERREVPVSALAGGILSVNRASGSPVDGLPCGAIYVYVFEGVQ